MNHKASSKQTPSLNWPQSLFYTISAIAAFHIAYGFAWSGFLILFFLFFLFRLADLGNARKAFYFGLGIGMLIYAPHLRFFWTIFQGAALALWLVLSFWLGLFLVLAHFAKKKCGSFFAALIIPILWTGLEYFRSELYYLRFSWLNIGYVFSFAPFGKFLPSLGVYGIGFLIALFASLLPNSTCRTKIVFGLILIGCLIFPRQPQSIPGTIRFTGVQLEFPTEKQALLALQEANQQFPDTSLFVLSEYTFDGAIPSEIKDWCRDNGKFLVAGGKHYFIGGKQFYNTAFVVGTNGEIIFQQAKSVPIQFFKDGLSANEQKLWESPWGKIGICICYDLSYRRVVDNLIAQGAQMLIVPTMDVVDWGNYQHKLHSRVAPMRAAEYKIPIFRLCSSGISQAVNEQGRVIASAPFPGENAVMSAKINLGKPGRLPLDHWLAPFAIAVTGAFILWLIISCILPKRKF